MREYVAAQLADHLATIRELVEQLQPAIVEAAELVCVALERGNKLLLFGNGGSAADAQHIAAELVNRFETQRRGLPALALTTDTSALTSISNDSAFSAVFERQIEALCRPGDLLVGLSTSGNSENVVRALTRGRALGAGCLGLTGGDGGTVKALCDVALVIPSATTARIQEAHILVGHILCGLVDQRFAT